MKKANKRRRRTLRHRRHRGGAVSLAWRVGLALAAGKLAAVAADVEASKLPPATEDIRVDFNRDIKPIFEQSCFRCHGPERPKSGFRLDNRTSALKGGDDAPDDIVPGDSARSKLVQYVAHVVEDMEMPPPGKADALTAAQIGVLRAWIDQGAAWPADAIKAARADSITATPEFQWFWVDGNKRKFREDWGQREGVGGGLEHFEMQQPVGEDAQMRVAGRALFDRRDYRLAFVLSKPNLGFVRGGYETARHYFNDTGGYYSRFATPPFQLDRDLSLDVGRAWFDAGLTLPNLPRLVLGYEYDYKDGDKSTLQWGPVTDLGSGQTKSIYPAYKHIQEGVHILKTDVTYDRWGWSFEDNARVEWYDLRTRRYDVTSYSTGPLPDSATRISESDRHTRGANAIHLEKQWTDWLFLTGGYFYSKLDGDAAFEELTTDGSGAPAFGDQWLANGIVLGQETHVFSVSSLLGPWQGFNLSAGVQQEWFHQDGFGNPDLRFGNPGTNPPLLFSDPIQVNGTMDKSRTSENVALRYTSIPRTVLYAEGRLAQEKIDQFEDQIGSDHEFLRDTDAANDLQDFRGGFRVSPWQAVSLDASYRHRDSQSDYHHLRDTAFSGTPGYGYPAFIRARDLTEQDVEGRLTWRPQSWLKLAFNYRRTTTDYETTTDGIPGFTITPGGTILAGKYKSQSFSLNTTFTAFRRLTLAATGSYGDSSITTAANDASYIAPWEGNLYSALGSATYVLSNDTDLIGFYSYSRSDYGQNNLDGLPLGIDYERHGLQVGISHQFGKQMTASLSYGFYQYREPTAGGANDYTAHGILATAAIKLR